MAPSVSVLTGFDVHFNIFIVVKTVGTGDTFMFLTQAELKPYLRCHRNVRGLEEFLNKTNTGLL